MSSVGSDLSDIMLQSSPASVSFDSDLQVAIRMAAAQGMAQPRYRNLHADAAQWLADLIVSERMQAVVEIGASNGYSTLHLAGAVTQTGGRLTSFEKYPERAALAQAGLKRGGVLCHANVVTGDGVALIGERSDPVDLLFLDIWPGDYITAVQNARRCLRPGSVVVADNMLEHRDRQGRIHSAAGSGAEEYLHFMDRQPRCRSVLSSMGSGLLVTRIGLER